MNFEYSDNRIFKEENGKLLAEITFPVDSNGVVNMNHTFVDPSLRGQGVADKLVTSAIEVIRSNGWKAVATCPYVVKWFEKHPDERSILI